MGNKPKALVLFKKSYYLDPNHFATNINLANYYFSSGNLEQAQPYYEKAMEIDPLDPTAYRNLAWIYAKVHGNKKKAFDLSTKLRQIDPNNFDANTHLGLVYWDMGKYPEAAVCFEVVLKWTPNDPTILRRYATCLLHLGPSNNKKALAYSERAVTLAPEDAACNRVYSKCLAIEGRYQEAHRFYYKSIEIDPGKRDLNYERILAQKL